ncbi:PilZ domain-containing protein [Sphingomicrobium nitratireducens]|uniref:PilZ domain-containing protein n=1 Tax=Sphingomicrobium nitratireducens TaxID=2964666 RepID=UPI002240B9E7
MEEVPVETTLYSLRNTPPAPEAEPGDDDRREGERHLTLFRVGSILVDGMRELCLIKNVSAGGMMIRVYRPMDEGTSLSVELKNGHPVSGKVTWTKGNSVGVAFDCPIDVVDLLATSNEGPRPRMPRIEVESAVTLHVDGLPYRGMACDISQGGIKVALDRDLKVDEDVVVTLPGLAPEAGVVRWRHAGEIGITFNRLMPLSGLVDWLQGQRGELRKAS